MAKGICNLSIIPVRSEPSGRSTLVNQLLFGDQISVIEEITDWYKIFSLHDNYEGWIEKNQIDIIDSIPEKTSLLVHSHTAVFESPAGKKVLLFGSSLHDYKTGLQTGINTFKLIEGEIAPAVEPSGSNITHTALKLLDSPYLWGGRSPFGIDCSGLVQLVFKVAGISLPRDAWQQAAFKGDFIDLIDESVEGDVAFFDNDEGRIIHTGIITGKGYIIHASGKVRIDPIDHFGIFNKDSGSYSHRLRVIKRFISIKT